MDFLAERYRKTPTEYLFPDRIDANGYYITDYAAFCFDEAAAIAGLYAKNRADKEAYEYAKAKEALEHPTDDDGNARSNMIPVSKRRGRKPGGAVLGEKAPPPGIAEIRETASGPIIVGTVPVIKRTKPYVRRMTVAEAAEAERKRLESEAAAQIPLGSEPASDAPTTGATEA